MTYLTAKDLREKLATLPDDTKITIKARTTEGDSLYFDLTTEAVQDKYLGGILYMNSEGLDLTIEAEKEQLKEEVAPW